MAPMTGHAAQVVRRYYQHIDDGRYDELAGILDPGFVHHRPDRTIEGREDFVRFMRDDRPRTDTVHELTDLFGSNESDDGAVGRIAARGTLRSDVGEELLAFVDIHAVGSDGRIETLWTYTR